MLHHKRTEAADVKRTVSIVHSQHIIHTDCEVYDFLPEEKIVEACKMNGAKE